MKPATPLPWAVFKCSDGVSDITTEDESVGIADRARAADAAYIVHACNAYPKLVDTLRDARLQFMYLNVKFQETGSGNAVLARMTALLSELGELE